MNRIQQKLKALAGLDIHRDILIGAHDYQVRSVNATGKTFSTMEEVTFELDKLLQREIYKRTNLEDLLL